MNSVGFLFCLFHVGISLQHRAPVLDISSDVYRGTIKETDTVVKVSPEIRILDGTGPVCSYVVEAYSNKNGSERDDVVAPFVVDVEDQTTGRAVVRLRADAILDCTDDVYRFKINAKRCGGDDAGISDSVTVEVRVEDTNNHEPRFKEQMYTVEVEEGKIFDRILQLDAVDDDCAHPYGEICRYEITNNAKSFTITQSGVLKNTQPLNWSESHSHVVSVVAHDCGMRRSKPTLITVKVKQPCVAGLSGNAEKLEYYPGDGASPLLADVAVRVCNGAEKVECTPTSVESKVRLNAVDAACDRESVSIEKQRKLCGVDSATVALLPNSKNVKFENSASSSEEDQEDEDETKNEVAPSTDEVFAFDGHSNAVIVTSDVLKPQIPETFTLSFWMKHEKSTKADQHHASKENIFCSSDEQRMNRHHFAVYVKNCKLEMLFRRESAKEADEGFSPAEWRWKLAQVCDGRWHHYSFNVQLPQVELLVDGRLEESKSNEPEILDDWPMHAVKDIKTKSVVGACWHGNANKMAQYFRGYLSGVTMLPGKVEPVGVAQCLMRCKEQLEFFGLDKLRPGEEAIFNNDMSELTLKAARVEDFVELLRKVSYLNSRSNPSVGERSISVSTKVFCKERTTPNVWPEIETKIFVNKRANAKIMLSGSVLLRRKDSEVEQGVNVFPDLKINVVNEKSGDVYETVKNDKLQLDYCKIKTNPPLDKQREYFSSPASLIGDMGLEFEHVADGLLLKGMGTAKNYGKVLEQIHYFNSRPTEFAKRIFYVVCAAADEYARSDEFIVSLSIDSAVEHDVHQKVDADFLEFSNETDQKTQVDVKVETAAAATTTDKSASAVVDPLDSHREETPLDSHAAVQKLDNFAPQPKIGSGAIPLVHQSSYDGFGPTSQTGPGGAIAIVVVVCVGFLLLLIVVGILKVRSTHRRLIKTRRPTEDGDLAWDDSGMNIIVNPIEEVVPEPAKPQDDVYSEGSSDDDSYRDDDDCSDDDDEEVLPHVEAASSRHGSTGLEWDDSTLHHPAVHNPRSHTYRV